MKKFINEREAVENGVAVSKCGNFVTNNGKPVKVTPDRGGYLRFSTKTDAGYFTSFVHRLQAYQKFGEALYGEGMETRHLNNIKDDNSWDNIAIGTAKQNTADKDPAIRRRAALLGSQAARITRIRYPDEMVLELRAFFAETKSTKQTMAKFGINRKSTLNRLLKRRHIGGIPGIKEVEANRPNPPAIQRVVTFWCDNQAQGHFFDTVGVTGSKPVSRTIS